MQNSTWTPTSIHSINPPIFSMIILSLRPCLLSLTLLGLVDMAMWSLTLGRSRPTWRACVLDENDNGILRFFHKWLNITIFVMFYMHVFDVIYMYICIYICTTSYACVCICMFDILLIYVYSYFDRTVHTYIQFMYDIYISPQPDSLLWQQITG